MDATTRNTRRSGRFAGGRRRGAALVEMAMCIPLLALLMVVTMFFGWAMLNQQEVKAASRYVAWENVYSLSLNSKGLDPNHVEDWTDANDATLNQMFFRGEAASASIAHRGVNDDEYQQWIADASGRSKDGAAGAFCAALILDPPPGYGHFNHTAGADVWATFITTVDAFRRFGGGDMHAMHVRGGLDWCRSEADSRNVTRIQFLMSLESRLNSVASPGSGMAEMMKGTYHDGW